MFVFFVFFPLLFLLLFRHKNIVSALGIWPSAIHSGLWILSRKGKGQARRRCAATHAHTNKQDKKTRSNDRLLHTREWCSSAMTIFSSFRPEYIVLFLSLFYIFLFDLFFFLFFLNFYFIIFVWLDLFVLFLFFIFLKVCMCVLTGIFASRIRNVAQVQVFAARMCSQMPGDHIPSACGVRALRTAIGLLPRVRPLVGAEVVGA